MIATMAFFIFTGIVFHDSPEAYEADIKSKEAELEMSHRSVTWNELKPALLKILNVVNSNNQNDVMPIKTLLDEVHVVLFEYLCNPEAHLESEERNIDDPRDYYDIKLRRLLNPQMTPHFDLTFQSNYSSKTPLLSACKEGRHEIAAVILQRHPETVKD